MSAWLLGGVLGVLVSAPGSTLAATPALGVRAAGPLPTPQFRLYGTTDGLPSGAIYAVAQDRHGLLWFGSAGGLVRFDGVDFTVFRHVVGDPQSLPANQTYALFVDRDNRIWAGGVSTGLIGYDQTSGRFRHWEHADDQPDSLADNEVWSIAQTSDGALWVATQGGLDRLRADGRGFDHIAREVDGRREPFGAVRALLAEADGRLWIGAHSGLYLRQSDGTIRRVPVDPSFHGELGKAWRIDGGDGEVRVALEGGLLVIGADGVARPLASPQLSSLRILGSARDAQGRLWMGSLNGVWMDAGGGRLQHIVGQPLLPGGLPGDRLWQLLRDREGGLWFTFDQSSIAYLPPGWNGFTRFTHVPDDPHSLSNIAALSVHRSRDRRLWVGGFNGWIDKLDPATGEVEHVLKGLRGNLASLAEDTRGRLWIAGPGELYRYDRGKLTAIEAKRSHVNRPTALVAGDDGRIYVSSWGQGVFALDSASMVGSSLMPADAPGDTRFHDQLSFHAGRLWYASAGGLLRGDGASQRLAFVPGVPHHEILAFAFDAGGFWTATSEALEHYREVDGRAERDASVDISRQPFAADLMAIEVDRQDRLWLFANPGLWRFEPTTRQFTAFGPSQGLSSGEFTNGSVELAPDGTLFAASGGGVMAFRPERLARLQQHGAAPPLTLTAVTVRRGNRVQPLAPGPPVRLPWRDRDLHVEARVASFVNPAANCYRFRLHGFDSDWVDTGSRGGRDFSGLGAGDYTLDVMAAGANGQWVRLATPLRIHVEAPPWRRWWAWAIYVLLAAALVGLVLHGWRRRLAQRHHVQLVEQQRQLAEAASAAKTQFLATLSHEIRTPMTGVMGMAELLLSTPLNRQQHDYTQAMQRSGGMLLKLLNDALDLARIEAGRLELEPVPFDPRQLLEDVAQLEQGLAHAKGIRFVLALADELPAQLLGDAVRIKQILLNLANNALKFTEHGSVTLSAQRQPEGLQFSVSDTGPGIPEASQARLFQRFEQAESPQRRAGSGLGLAICRELVEMMGGSIELESRLGHGSTFRVRLPLVEPAAPVPVERPSGRRYRLLLVEDDTIVAAVIRGLLEREGHAVVHVVNGLAALAELAHAQFDAVLLDLDLPGVDGFQIARLIRQREPAGRHLPIVAVTARQGSEDEAKARAAGMDGFLRKPLSGEQLAAALARVVASAGDAPA
ncbi:hybrid sensor histidine kinase/response regulator [Rhodanobacter denitrificans]|uniref:hybrid sensor histidine kinase/response regulator n=3 Tax=Rhodanobacter denitrificans TaxID=666685 RepID=UPI001F452630|nr:hybrid sensor histidine kinase/response regulator [Rhodanobacter denitrificans]UJJ57413.1 ATP-binding protein [Rhodanobacter denitrificans]UJM93117.1 ATP-binding protein [Rhodanobacter denitrificans]UJM96649.1 ATP-binding protein [Rhodanobacter denitrificans]UJN20522.1 ATP-binding protein [Rhodanobacter denitrificans]